MVSGVQDLQKVVEIWKAYEGTNIGQLQETHHAFGILNI